MLRQQMPIRIKYMGTDSNVSNLMNLILAQKQFSVELPVHWVWVPDFGILEPLVTIEQIIEPSPKLGSTYPVPFIG